LKKACPKLTDAEVDLLTDKLRAMRALIEEEKAASSPPTK
jgi:hypothetical protein